MTNDDQKTSEAASRAMFRALIGVAVILAMPIVILLGLLLINGWSERNLEQNFFIVVLIIIWPLNWAFDKVMLAPWWDRYKSRFLKKKHREGISNGLTFIAVFSLIDLDEGEALVGSVVQYVTNFATFGVLLLIAHVIWELVAAWWKHRKT